MCFTKLFDWFFEKRYDITKPEITKLVSAEEIKPFFEQQLNTMNDTDVKVYLADHKYKLAPYGEYIRMIKHNKINLTPYETDYMDCDDFALHLAGAFAIPGWSALPFGMLSVNTGHEAHRINVFLDDAMKVWCVESQSDHIWKPSEKNWQYFYVDIS